MSFHDQMTQILQQHFPISELEPTVQQQEQRNDQLQRREDYIEDKDFTSIIAEYGVDPSLLKESEPAIYTIKVKKHFSTRRLPKGYGYKGGAARALLLMNLGLREHVEPRDIDVMRFDSLEPYPGSDTEVALAFMKDDFELSEGRHGVEQLTQNYFTTRDMTINEVLATDEQIQVTKQGLLDTVRNIIRPTQYELKGGGLSTKMRAKILRFYAEAIAKDGYAVIKGVTDWGFEEYFFGPFFLSVQLDRACERGILVAQQYVQELVRREIIPAEYSTVEAATEYFVEQLRNSRFYFRHAPVNQLNKEYEWIGEQYEHLPKQQSHSRGR